jgi:hypothetical protein
MMDAVMSVSKQIALQVDFPQKRTPAGVVTLVNFGADPGSPINKDVLSLCEYDE